MAGIDVKMQAGTAASLPPNIPVQRDAIDSTTTTAGTWLGVAGLLVLLAILAWWGRRRQLGTAVIGSPAPTTVRASGLRLSPRHSLHVVEWEGRRLLVGCSEQSICLVAESPDERGKT